MSKIAKTALTIIVIGSLLVTGGLLFHFSQPSANSATSGLLTTDSKSYFPATPLRSLTITGTAIDLSVFPDSVSAGFSGESLTLNQHSPLTASYHFRAPAHLTGVIINATPSTHGRLLDIGYHQLQVGTNYFPLTVTNSEGMSETHQVIIDQPSPPTIADSTTYLSQLLQLPTQTFHPVAQAQMQTNLARFDRRLLYLLAEQGIKIYLTNGNYTRLPQFSHLRNQLPNGWQPESGYTYRQTCGMFDQQTKSAVARIDCTDANDPTPTELHEVAHAIDYALSRHSLSNSSEFVRIKNEEAGALLQDRDNLAYFQANVEEYFAECLAMFVASPTTKTKLQILAPQTYAFIQAIYDGLPQINS